MKTIGVLTSGGDSPGMNTALRSIVRTCAHYKIKCVGIVRGYSGLIEDNTKVLNTRSVRGIINKGGTFLYSARCDEFRQASGRKKAYKTLRNNNIDGLIVKERSFPLKSKIMYKSASGGVESLNIFKVSNIKKVIQEEREKQKKIKIQAMQREKIEAQKRFKQQEELAIKAKALELREEEKLGRERKIELQKFIRLEQAELRKERAEKQRKFLEQIALEKKIEQFRKREALEIKNLEKYVLSQQRESYEEVQQRIERIKEKYRSLREQKVNEAIRERVAQLGIKIEDTDNKETLLEKERIYNQEREKIEYALESFYRSAHSLCFQINKRYIPKYLSIMRVVDRRFETGEIFIKWDDTAEDDWLILIYIKDNSPDEGIIIEDKSNPEKHNSYEFKPTEIFRASDLMVDSLTKLLDRERNKKKVS